MSFNVYTIMNEVQSFINFEKMNKKIQNAKLSDESFPDNI